MDLDNGFSRGHGVVVHVGVEEGKAPSNENVHLAGVKLIAHADFERPGDDRDVFPARVPMRRDTEPIRHLQANRKIASRGSWVTFEYGKLRTWTYNGRCRPPGDGIRCECVFFVRVIVRGADECQPRPREYPSHCKCEKQVSFHGLSLRRSVSNGGIMSRAERYSNEERIPFAYLFPIVANY